VPRGPQALTIETVAGGGQAQKIMTVVTTSPSNATIAFKSGAIVGVHP